MLAAIRAGDGPSYAFRRYLLTSVRHLAHDWLQARRRLTVVGDLDVQTTDAAAGPGRVSPGIGAAAETQAEARDEARLVTRAFGQLPARWREVLWQLEPEGKAPAAAPMFGLSANGVSALAVRAREGLRQAYLEEHVAANVPAACRSYAAEFGVGARDRLSQRRRAPMQEHLGHCPACQDLFTELTELNSRLGAILTPAALAAAVRSLGQASDDPADEPDRTLAHLAVASGHLRHRCRGRRSRGRRHAPSRQRHPGNQPPPTPPPAPRSPLPPGPLRLQTPARRSPRRSRNPLRPPFTRRSRASRPRQSPSSQPDSGQRRDHHHRHPSQLPPADRRHRKRHCDQPDQRRRCHRDQPGRHGDHHGHRPGQ